MYEIAATGRAHSWNHGCAKCQTYVNPTDAMLLFFHARVSCLRRSENGDKKVIEVCNMPPMIASPDQCPLARLTTGQRSTGVCSVARLSAMSKLQCLLGSQSSFLRILRPSPHCANLCTPRLKHAGGRRHRKSELHVQCTGNCGVNNCVARQEPAPWRAGVDMHLERT
jgi:hypothetical protein